MEDMKREIIIFIEYNEFIGEFMRIFITHVVYKLR